MIAQVVCEFSKINQKLFGRRILNVEKWEGNVKRSCLAIRDERNGVKGLKINNLYRVHNANE